MLNEKVQFSATLSKTLLCLLLTCAMALSLSPHVTFAANTTTANTPTAKTDASWTFDYKAYSGVDWPNASEPVTNGDYVYFAVNNKLVMLNKSDGKVAKEAELVTNIGYTTRPVLVNGLVVVPLNDGRIQANKVDTLEKEWATETIKSGAQNCSTMTADGNNVYFSTVDVDYTAGTYTNGYMTCVNTATGETVWQNVDENEGYYWSGGTIAGNNFVISGCNGTLKVFDKATGELKSTSALGALVNSDVVTDEEGTCYVMTRDGKLHTFNVSEANEITNVTTKDIGLTGCACTPTLSGSSLFVGGEVDNGNGSALAIVDLATYSTQLIKNSDDTPLLGGGIKGAPLVATTSAGTFVYFTVNNAVTEDWVTYTAGGGVFVYKVGDEKASSLYDAAGHFQYCDSPVTCDSEGNLYYINDSCTVFKIAAQTQDSVAMNRLYNPYSGEHLYTASADEKSTLITCGWVDEGIGWKAPSTSKTPVYRLYNQYNSDHHYTMDEAEKKACVEAGWTFEGIGWYSDDDKSVPVYRQFNPYEAVGTHNYTSSETERDTIVKLGWVNEGIGWYGIE